MDRPLSADRYGGGGGSSGGGFHDGSSGGRGYYGGGGAGRSRYRGGGGGRRGRGGGRGHQPYGRRGRGGGDGGGGQRNRFGADQNLQNQDPEALLLRQVSSMISRVGEFNNLKTTSNSDGDATDASATNTLSNIISLRPVEATTARNVSDLVPVLLNAPDRMETFLKYQNDATDPEKRAGSMCHLVVSCAAGLPLQTPCYAALTLAVHEHVRSTPPYGTGFASRCVDYATWHIGRDLDSILLKGGEVSTSPLSAAATLTAQAACRVKLLLRYLALLGKMGIIQTHPQEDGADTESNKQTLVGVLRRMIDAAKAASQPPHNNSGTCYLLVSFVLSTLPYLMGTVPQDKIDELLLGPAQALFSSYQSTYRPGTGSTAILLKGEQAEGDDDGADDDDDDEEDDEEDESGPICDSIQDLFRISQRLSGMTRFALPADAPWRGLTQNHTPNPESGETETRPVTYSDDAKYISLSECRSLWLLTSESVDSDGSKTIGNAKVMLSHVSLEGVVFGRLPIFGSPRDPDDDVDDDDDDGMDETTPKNEQLEAFKENFTLLDRFFVGDVLRDCLISHETLVNPSGVQLGSAKSVAEELLSVAHMFTGHNATQGMEYAIVETVFGLLAQSRDGSALKHTFLSQVLLELIKSNPSLFSRPLIVGVTNLFDHYLPALVPSARDNFSHWLAFHLTNTDYQWPGVFWKLWEPYATSPNATSRGDFVRRTIHSMVNKLSDPKRLLSGCLSETPSLVNEFFPRPNYISIVLQEDDMHFKLEEEVNRRVWEIGEDPKELLEFLESGPVSEMISNGALMQERWVLSRILARVFCTPAKGLFQSLKESLSASEDDDGMVDDSHQTKDAFGAIIKVIDRYSETMNVILRKENAADGELENGQSLVLQEIEGLVYFNESMLRGIIGAMLNKKTVNGLGVLRWSLGGSLVPRWSTYAVDALVSASSPSPAGSGMVLDGTQAETDARTSRKILLQFAANRVRPLLVAQTGKRMDAMQVNLVEGMKTMAVIADSMNKRSSLEDDGTINSLADLCVGADSSQALAILKKSLSSM